MWLVGSQSVVWFSNFTRTCKLSFMKRGTKVLYVKRSRFSDYFAHLRPSEQAGLRIWLILTFDFYWKCTRNPSNHASEPTFSTAIGSTPLSWFQQNIRFSRDFFEITFFLLIWKHFQKVAKHEIPFFTHRKYQFETNYAITKIQKNPLAFFIFFGFQKPKKVVLP